MSDPQTIQTTEVPQPSPAFSLEDAIAATDDHQSSLRKQIAKLLRLMDDPDSELALAAHRLYWTIIKDLYRMRSGTLKVKAPHSGGGFAELKGNAPMSELARTMQELNAHGRRYESSVRSPFVLNSGPVPDPAGDGLPSPFDPLEEDDPTSEAHAAVRTPPPPDSPKVGIPDQHPPSAGGPEAIVAPGG